MEETIPPRMITPRLVGRASQFASLQLFVEQAKRGEGHMVLISGEAGIGKSRLLAEVKTFAKTQGLLILQGHCFPTDLTYPYAPLLDLIRSLFASHLDGRQPSAGTESCEVPHFNYGLSGRLHIRMDDGMESEIGPGDAQILGPGHDAWVVGDEPYVGLDFQGGHLYGKSSQ